MRTRTWMGGLGVWVGMLGAPAALWAAPLVVTTTADTVAVDGACSLREAVTALNGLATVNECVYPVLAPTSDITFNLPAPSTINLGSVINITRSMTITGQGAANTVLDAGLVTGMFNIPARITVHLTGMTLQRAQVGAVVNAGSVFLDQVTCQDSVQPGGGACLINTSSASVDASATITNSSFVHNNPLAIDATGGAIRNSGLLTITGSLFQNNGAALGAAVATQPGARATSTTLTNCSFLNNAAHGQGGAISVALGQPLTVSRSVFRLNHSGGGAGGGAIIALGGAWVTDSRFDNNSSFAVGGALVAGGSVPGVTFRVNLQRTSFLNNTALGAGGALWLSADEALVATNVTMAGNSSNADGGAIYAPGPNAIHLNNVTLAQNQANAAGTGSGTGGGIYMAAGGFTVQNSVITQNDDHGSINAAPDCRVQMGMAGGGGMVSHDYNVLGSLQGCVISGAGGSHDVAGVAVPFDPPSAQAGPLLGHAASERVAILPVAAGSPLINAGNPAGCTDDDGVTTPALTVDAQSRARPLLQCDIGAQETPCGNGLLDPGELCDDGNLLNTDSCLRTCMPNVCGDGQRNPATEQCDNGAGNGDRAACLTSCRLASCGDGHVQTRVEQCDDGNLVDGDGCDHTCQVEGAASSSGGGSSGGVVVSSSGPVVASSSAPPASSAGGPASGLDCPQPTLNQCEDPLYIGSACGRQAVAHGRCVSVCPTSLSSTQCHDAAFGGTVCGREAVNAGTCTTACASTQGLTVAQCESTWLESVCGQLETARWSNAVNQQNLSLSTCATLKAQLSDGGVVMLNPPPSTVRTVTLPLATMDGQGNRQSIDPLTHDQAAVFPYQPSHLQHVGGSSTYRGWRTHQSMRAAGVNPNFPFLDSVMDAIFKANMNANGKRVDSCKEYVFEKYWNFSKWEDETEGAGSHWRTYVDVAYASPRSVQALSVLPASAIGTRGEQHLPIRSRDGKQLTKQVEFEADNHAKNIFFSIGPPEPVGAEPNPLGDVVAQILGPAAMADLPMCGGSVYPTRLYLCSQSLASTIYSGVHNHAVTDRGWAYHHTKSVALRAAGYTDEDLYSMDGIKNRYARLLRRRGEIVAEFWAQVSAPAHKRYLPAGTQLPDAINSPDPAWSLLDTMQNRLSMGGLQTAQVTPITSAFAGAAAKNVLSHGLGGSALQRGFSLGAVTAALNLDINSSQQGGQHMLSHHVDTGAESPPIVGGGVAVPAAASLADFRTSMLSLMQHLLYVDALLEATLTEAEGLHCLALDDTNPCDWSPRDFAQAVVGYYAADQEADYQRCARNTAGAPFATGVHGRLMRLWEDGHWKYPELSGLAVNAQGQSALATFPCVLDDKGNLRADKVQNSADAVKTFDPKCAKNPNDPNSQGCNDWNKDTTHLDTYFQCVDSLKALVIKTVEKLGNLMDEKGRVRLAQSTGDTEQAGNDDFNLHYGYAFGWALGGFENYVATPTATACTLKPELYAHMNAGATAFHHSVELVEGSGHVRTSTYEAFNNLNALHVTPDTLEFKVLGMDLFTPAATNVSVSADIVKGQEEKNQDFLRVTVPFALGPIPMSLTGGIAGRLGVQYGATAELDTQNVCTKTKLTGYFTPYAGVDGFAEVGIDILVAAAGVKITLVIIEADLPFTVAVGLASVDGFPGLAIETNMDLVLKTLGGRISVYLRILFASWDWTIFSWDGFQNTLNIFHAGLNLQLEPLRMALADMLNKPVQ